MPDSMEFCRDHQIWQCRLSPAAGAFQCGENHGDAVPVVATVRFLRPALGHVLEHFVQTLPSDIPKMHAAAAFPPHILASGRESDSPPTRVRLHASSA